MDEVTNTAALVIAALALGLVSALSPDPIRSMERKRVMQEDGVVQALLSHAIPYINNGPDRTVKGNSQRPLRPANLLRKFDWQYDMGDWYLSFNHSQETTVKSEPEVHSRTADRYGMDERLVVTQAAALATDAARENNGRRLIAAHHSRPMNDLHLVWRNAGSPVPRGLNPAHWLPDMYRSIIYPTDSENTVVNQFGSPGFTDYTGAKANRERLTRLRALEAQRETVVEPAKPSQWLSRLEEGGFKAGLPKEHKPKAEKRPTIVSRAVLPNGERYTVYSPKLAPLATRYVPCNFVTLMESVIQTDPDTGQETTVEDYSAEGVY
jgi:hypothetical protein